MHFDIVTLFPELISSYFEDSILKRAKENGLISIKLHQLRSYALDKHKQVDDTPYGGGGGMLLRVDVLGRAVEAVKADDRKAEVIYLSPQGKKLDHKLAKKLSKNERLILVCGRYEGVDQRFIDGYVDMEVSIGDYVLSGGELPAAVLIEAVSRFIPGVIGKESSVLTDSFENELLKYPQYTKPRDFNGISVPEILLSGDHSKIDTWRRKAAKDVKSKKRKDLI